MVEPVGLATIIAAGVLCLAALASVTVTAYSVLTTDKPAGLHHTSEYIWTTFSTLRLSLRNVRCFTENFRRLDEEALRRGFITESLMVDPRFESFIKHVRVLLADIEAYLSTTDNQKLERAFQSLHLLALSIEGGRFSRFWDFLRQDKVSPDVNLIADIFNHRHPAVRTSSRKDPTAGSILAVSNVHTGLFVGTDRLLQATAELGANRRFQQLPQSTVRLVYHGSAANLDNNASETTGLLSWTAGPEALDTDVLKHGDKVLIEVEGGPCLYKPTKREMWKLGSLRAWNDVRIGHPLGKPPTHPKLQWIVKHNTFELPPEQAQALREAPIVVGSPVGFWVESWWGGNRALHALSTRQLMDTGDCYTLYHRPELDSYWSELCSFTMMPLSIAASWSFRTCPRNA